MSAFKTRSEKDLCHANKDGECTKPKVCPQIKDGEPIKTGRHCPIDKWDEYFDDGIQIKEFEK